MLPVTIESLDQEGRGVTHVDGKTIFVEGALPGERVTYVTRRRKPTWELASVDVLHSTSSMRVSPRCPHFGVCGGCSLQHQDPAAQVAAKQRVLEDAFWHIGRVRPETMLPPIHGPAWEYRHRARLTVRHVARKGGVLVGFHERRSSFVTDMTSCAVLPKRISDLLPHLRALVGELTIRTRLPQIELALGDEADVLVLRILEPLAAEDRERLGRFAAGHGVEFWLQPEGPATAVPMGDTPDMAHYSLPDFGVRFAFLPTEFTQVNFSVNRVLVSRAVRLLAPQADDRVADFFCGLGNFSLPLATRARAVIGIEGSESLVGRARDNAMANGLAGRTEFVAADLFAVTDKSLAAFGAFSRALIDPPREGAMALVQALPAGGLARLVYVSCSPATLARDAGVLVHERGYRLASAGVVNMFPHTAHVESIAVFEPA